MVEAVIGRSYSAATYSRGGLLRNGKECGHRERERRENDTGLKKKYESEDTPLHPEGKVFFDDARGDW
jgi:hypothetical protein